MRTPPIVVSFKADYDKRNCYRISAYNQNVIDKSASLAYIFYDKGNDEEEYALPLKREGGCHVFPVRDGR